MALPASTPTLEGVRQQVDGTSLGLKSFAQSALAILQANTVDGNWIFRLLDTIKGANDNITAQGNLLGSTNYPALNAYIAAQKPGYLGVYTTDVSAVMSAASAAIAWVVANFPRNVNADGTTGTFVLALTLNADGTRTPASFTSAQTLGLQQALQALIATIT